jgi:anthranilate phosphoribosyltransferase
LVEIKAIIKEIGRGANGARALSPDLAYESFGALLRGDLEDVQLGAWWLAMRIKGESEEELTAFERAMQDTLSFRVVSSKPVVVLPCYNGARQLPNLTPLLAWSLANLGVHVLLHGVRSDPTRVTTFELFNALDFPVASDADHANRALHERGFAFAAIDSIHPALATLLANRWRIGVRSTPHTVVKLLQPVEGAALRVVALTHGDYIERMSAHLMREGASAMVFRGCEGEPVLHPKRKVTLQVFRKGETHMREWQGVTEHDLPDTCDIATTVAYIQGVMSGRHAMPAWIAWLAQEMQRAAHDIQDIPI